MPLIRARAPLRLGLAGGGSDVSPYCDIYGGFVLNAAIDRYAYAVIKTLDQPVVRFVACDQQLEQARQAEVPLPLDGKMNLHAATYNYIMQNFNDGKPMANGGKIIGSIDNIKIYDLTEKNQKIKNTEFNNTYENLNLTYSEDFSNCETKTCNNSWVLQNPKTFFIDNENENFSFISEVSGTNDYAHFEFLEYITSDEWLMNLQLKIDEIDEHPRGKGVLNIDPSYRIFILVFSIILFTFSIILLIKIIKK